ncbi:hypothetical protein K439DRAFT_1380796 [Ramaria rubella]|nr:hypothetical protein K439DRAFT_1380796 [Ramaria rubella]
MPPNADLRFAPWQNKNQLSSSQYSLVTTVVSKVLSYTVSLPADKLNVPWTRAFIRTYAQDEASHALYILDEHGATATKLSPHELSIRKSTLLLAGRLARVQDGLDASILVDLAVAYGASNSSTSRTIFEEACTSTPSLFEQFKGDVVPAFTASLQDVQRKALSSTRNAATVLSRLLACGSSIVKLFMQDKDFVLTLARCYHIELDNIATARGGIKLSAVNTSTANGWQRDWLYTKTGIINSFHAIVQTFLQSQTPHDKDLLFVMLFAIMELPSSSASDCTIPIPFVSQSLLVDYQYSYDLSSVLNDKFRGADDARVDLLVATLAELSQSPHGPKPAGGLSLLIKDAVRVHREPTASISKGKAKASNHDTKNAAVLDLAVSQVLDIFPAYTPQHIRRCLEHSAFDGEPEKLISSLLEGTLPLELAEHADVPESIAQTDGFKYKYVNDRRNAWDDDVMDFSKLRIGKTRDNADALLQDRSFIEQMKADIIRRAEELSEDEETDIALHQRRRTIPFEEDLIDDGLDALGDKSVKVVGDGEDSDESGEEEDAGDVSAPQASSPETILELAYLDNPNLFDRDAATRRSKTRTELKAKTGWGDEQIEGWRIMLERNPKKDKILQKHEFSGNISLALNRNILEPGPSGASHTSPQRGRGGDGRGRGRGNSRGRGGGAGDTARGRAWKDKNKARSANHNRKRGHDKKMTRGEGPPA